MGQEPEAAGASDSPQEAPSVQPRVLWKYYFVCVLT